MYKKRERRKSQYAKYSVFVISKEKMSQHEGIKRHYFKNNAYEFPQKYVEMKFLVFYHYVSYHMNCCIYEQINNRYNENKNEIQLYFQLSPSFLIDKQKALGELYIA